MKTLVIILTVVGIICLLSLYYIDTELRETQRRFDLLIKQMWNTNQYIRSSRMKDVATNEIIDIASNMMLHDKKVELEDIAKYLIIEKNQLLNYATGRYYDEGDYKDVVDFLIEIDLGDAAKERFDLGCHL